MSPIDAILLSRWLERRDAEAFKQLTSRYAGMVYATCLRVLGNPSDSEDVTQECFEELAGAARRPKGYLGPWLHKVAMNRALDRLKGEKRRKSREARFVAEQVHQFQPSWDDIYEHVDKAITDLPERLRVPLFAHFFQGESHAAIAESLGTSRQTVTYRIAKAVKCVRRTLKKQGIPVTTAGLAAMMSAHLAEGAPLPPSLGATLAKLAVAGLEGAAANVAVVGASGLAAVVKTVLAVSAAGAVLFAGGAAFRNYLVAPEKPPARFSPQPEDEPSPRAMADSPREPATPSVATGTGTEPSAGERAGTADGAAPSNVQGAVISGRVFDADTKQGIPDAMVDARRVDGGRGGWAETSASGEYQIEGLAGGAYEVGPSILPGYPRFGVRRKWVTVSVSAEQVMEAVDFAFDRGVRVSGRVVSSDGSPVNGARVGAMTDNMPGSEHTTSGEGAALRCTSRRPAAGWCSRQKPRNSKRKWLAHSPFRRKGLTVSC